MLRKKATWLVLSAAVAVGMAATSARAQDAQQPAQGQQQQQQQQDNGGRGNRGGFGRGNFDPAQFRQRMMDNIKEQLGAKDDEWQAIQPRLEKVMDLQRQTRVGGFGGFTRRGGQGGGPGGGRPNPFGADPNSPVAKATEELRTALAETSTSADEISKRLKTLRDARESAKTELTKAQADLKEILSQRQEAQLVLSGMLE